MTLFSLCHSKRYLCFPPTVIVLFHFFVFLFFSHPIFCVSFFCRIAHLTSSNVVGLPKIYNIHQPNDGCKMFCTNITLPQTHTHTHTYKHARARRPSHVRTNTIAPIRVVHPCISLKNPPTTESNNNNKKMCFVAFTGEKKSSTSKFNMINIYTCINVFYYFYWRIFFLAIRFFSFNQCTMNEKTCRFPFVFKLKIAFDFFVAYFVIVVVIVIDWLNLLATFVCHNCIVKKHTTKPMYIKKIMNFGWNMNMNMKRV